MLYGRRHGRMMRPKRQALVSSLLPQLTIEISGDGTDVEPLHFADIFDWGPKDVWLEIGFGAGDHLVAQAVKNPRVGFIGCEPFFEGIGKLISRIDSSGVTNIRVYPGDVRDLIAALPLASLGKVFLLFPDPWPKNRHHKRRIINKGFLDKLASCIRVGGDLLVWTDHAEYVRWILHELLQHESFSWTARGPNDWRIRPESGQKTRYETKARAAGRQCFYLRFKRCDTKQYLL